MKVSLLALVHVGSLLIAFSFLLAKEFRDYFQFIPQHYNDFVVGPVTWVAVNRTLDFYTVVVFLLAYLTIMSFLLIVLKKLS